MARNYNELRKKLSPETRTKARKRAAEMIANLPLNQLRKARKLTQEMMAERIGVAQGEISKIENRTDVYLSTLREYVKALGGELVIRAEFPDGAVDIEINPTNRAA